MRRIFERVYLLPELATVATMLIDHIKLIFIFCVRDATQTMPATMILLIKNKKSSGAGRVKNRVIDDWNE